MINLSMQYLKENNDHMLVDPLQLHINSYVYSEILLFIKQKKKFLILWPLKTAKGSVYFVEVKLKVVS